MITEIQSPKIALRATEVANVQEEIRKTVIEGAVAIIQSAVERVKEESSYQLIKFLFEIAGLYPTGLKESETKELSLARMLCRELGLPENPELETATTVPGRENIQPSAMP